MLKIILFPAVWVASLVVIVLTGAYLYNNPYLEKHFKCIQLHEQKEDLQAAARLEPNDKLEDQLKSIINKREALDCLEVAINSTNYSRDYMTNLRFIAVILSTIAAFAAVGLAPKSDKKWHKFLKADIEVDERSYTRVGITL